MVAEESPRISSSYEACLPFTYWCQVHYLAASLVCSGEIVKDWFLIFHITKHDILSLKTDTGPLWWGRRLYIYISCQTIIERLLVIMIEFLPNLPFCFHKWDWVYCWCFCLSTSPSFFYSHYLLLSHCTKTTCTGCLFLTCWENRLSCVCWDADES